jgi:hypothetical protein
MTPASLLAVMISISPPTVVAFEPPPGTAEAPPPTVVKNGVTYEEALAKVNAAMTSANEDPSRGTAQLRDALGLLRDHAARLATDLEGQELRTMAQLTLARALLAADNGDAAREAMDEAIRTSRGDPLPTKTFGPGLVALHREREGMLAKQGTGSIEVECHTPCSVYLNERRSEQIVEGLVPGSYRVRIEAKDGSVDPIQDIAQIEPNAPAIRIEFGTPAIVEVDTPPPREPKPRMLPRWADILIMSAGAAAIGTGAALWAIDGSCPKGADPNDPIACPRIYMTKTAGIITVAAGGAVFLSGTVLLSVDEVRTARNKSTAAVTLSWAMRF